MDNDANFRKRKKCQMNNDGNFRKQKMANLEIFLCQNTKMQIKKYIWETDKNDNLEKDNFKWMFILQKVSMKMLIMSIVEGENVEQTMLPILIDFLEEILR